MEPKCSPKGFEKRAPVREASGRRPGAILEPFWDDFRGPGGPKTAPGVARSAPRAAQDEEKGLKKGLLSRSRSSGGSGGRFWSLRGSILEPPGVDVGKILARFRWYFQRCLDRCFALLFCVFLVLLLVLGVGALSAGALFCEGFVPKTWGT